MDEQTNDQVQAIRQDVEGLKDQLAKILELLTTGRGKSVAGISSQVKVDLNQVLEDMPAYPPGFTPQRSSSPHMTYPTQNPNLITQQENHVSDPMSTPIQKVRWRELVAQVQPPLTDKELMAMFINTLQAPYYDRMVGSASTNFSDVITIGERIEFGVKNGRISDPASEIRRMMTPKKKEEEIHELSSTQRVVHVSSPTVGQTNYSYSYQNGGKSPFSQETQRNARNSWKQPYFDPIPMSYTEPLPQLLKSHQVAIVPQEPLQPPYPKWYDPNVKCEYHAGVVGHSIENCFPLKAKVQSLVKTGWLEFKKT
ncbi:uncharacterized protein E5676_scaffold519G00030 [Cucumis melo var. makuwa]|uniref:Uncharacterized protein n=1 Tax=Cucumis melo var. makuwa TaxID=1194695 RepID=A0A5D3D9Y2_CUCMM|nr:uncharacterized protein E6C27_scaffold24G003640 [Cucumis melo var. makuwa]TYK20387.1 uncharacterized protein E5676_scaffold519G00030 [Cucumis melo var. makuwa]